MDLRSFLKKFSTLNNDFIDDFYNIYDPDKNIINDYPISIDTISKWLNTKKGKLKETLINTYTKNIDYKIQSLQFIMFTNYNIHLVLSTNDLKIEESTSNIYSYKNNNSSLFLTPNNNINSNL